ncbi:glycosyltransferase [Hyunsoonleella sp. SJ7]|uniref:Glycosyltransferase n=1 Tax=Hyunsoonleella aquatilis TaxID=2762758 RepID=A0A923H7L6_9FLAO|nr:glycosyltransferase [Hyunsoonleella aquatilis]MBC3757450.1 glycosyltransferase [Hyunsoonleella aquatilis]
MKICLLADCLSLGGAEKMAANMSVSLSKRGYDVWIVSMKDEIDYEYAGTLYNFGKVKAQHNRFQAFLKFRAFFRQHQFDVIIDHRVRDKFLKEFLFAKVVFNGLKVVYCWHNDSQYLSVSNIFLARQTMAKKNKIVVVSKDIKQQIKQLYNFESDVIYNYVILKKKRLEIVPEHNYAIAVGRLEKVKQFDVLIKSYFNSSLREKNIKLLILGEGCERKYLEQLILKLNLQDYIELLGFRNDADTYIQYSRALIMSSKSEGFPMVLIEALALKTPVISFDCKSGPSEIIRHNINGLLVEDQNSEKLTEAMDKMILDKDFYASIKANLEERPNPFSEEKIIAQWEQLF